MHIRPCIASVDIHMARVRTQQLVATKTTGVSSLYDMAMLALLAPYLKLGHELLGFLPQLVASGSPHGLPGLLAGPGLILAIIR